MAGDNGKTVSHEANRQAEDDARVSADQQGLLFDDDVSTLPDDIGYFHAYYRQERPARKGRNYEFLHIQGKGHYVGTVMSVIQTQVSWFGEGDDLRTLVKSVCICSSV